jgi:hypothetical protein
MGMNNTALNNLDASGAPMNQASANTATPNLTANTWASSLVDQVSRRPSFLPSQVIAKVDATATPTRLIAIDKTAIPVGSTVATATGILTVPIGTAVSGIAGVTLNGLAFSNGSQFSLSGSTNLVINPNLIIQPSTTDTYIVTMSNTTGGSTTLATVMVSHDSTKITSVVISSGTLVISTAAIAGVTAPVAGATPVTTTTAGTGYTGTVTWSPAVSGTFAYNTAYTATVTLTATSGYTLTGVAANFFTVSGATTTNAINTGVVGAVFPATATLPSGYISTGTSSGSGSIGSGSGWGLSGVGTLIWSPNNSTVASPGYANYSDAASACAAMNTSSTLGYSSGWRLPTQPELSGLYNAGTGALTAAGWTLEYTWSSSLSTVGHHDHVSLFNGDVHFFIDYYNGTYVSCVH